MTSLAVAKRNIKNFDENLNNEKKKDLKYVYLLERYEVLKL